MDKVYDGFASLLGNKGLDLQNNQREQFEEYYKELVSWNETMNLTGITEREQVYLKHFYDSISLAFFIPAASVHSVIDVGSGAGFPSIPLKIMFPYLQVTIVDSLNKRIGFLNHLIKHLRLNQVQCIHGRAEDVARHQEYRDQFDLATARAVARLNVLTELCLPFVKKGGLFVAMKGADPSDEVTEARFSIKELDAELEQVVAFELPVEHSDRHLIIIRKLQATSMKYPRKAGTPLRNPLTK